MWLRLTITITLALSLFLQIAPAHAVEIYHIIVEPEHDEARSLELDHPAYNKVKRQIMDTLQAVGNQRVYEREINCDKECRHKRQALLKAIKASNKALADNPERAHESPIDLLVSYRLSRITKSSAGQTKSMVKVGVSAVQLDGQQVFHTDGDITEAAFEFQPKLDQLGLLEWEASRAARTARDEADYLLRRILEGWESTKTYVIKLAGFANYQVDEVERLLRNHASYEKGSLKTDETSNARQQVLHTISDHTLRLTSSMPKGQLDTLLNRYFDDAGIQVLPSVNKLGVLTYQSKSTAHLLSYIAAVLGVILALLVLGISMSYRKHYKVLVRMSQEKQVSSGLAYLKERRVAFLPETKKWKAWREKWLSAEQQAATSLEMAKSCIHEHRYDEALESAQHAHNLNADLGEAAELVKQLPVYQKAHQDFTKAEPLLSSDPSEAAKLLTKVEQSHPFLREQATHLLEMAERNLREGELKQGFAAAESALNSGDAYAALGSIDASLTAIAGLEDFEAEREQLTTMRARALSRLAIAGDSIKLTGAIHNATITSKPSVQIGRPSSSGKADVEINFKRISRAGKQTSITRSGSLYSVADQGSTHGTAIDGVFLDSGSKQTISPKAVLALGGDRGNQLGPCRLVLQSINVSLLLRFDEQSMSLLDQTQLSSAWPSLDSDTQSKWLMLKGEVPVGEFNGQLDVGCLGGGPPLFYFVNHKDVLSVRPLAESEHRTGDDDQLGQNQEPEVIRINGNPMAGTVPLPVNGDISVKHYRIDCSAADHS